MTNEVFWLYLLTRLDAINFILILGSILGSIAIFIGAMISFDDAFDKETSEKWLSYKWPTIIVIILASLVPNKNQMMFIISGTGLLEIAKSDGAQRIGGKSVQVFEKYLDEMLKEDKK
jgi:hypothetical protein